MKHTLDAMAGEYRAGIIIESILNARPYVSMEDKVDKAIEDYKRKYWCSNN